MECRYCKGVCIKNGLQSNGKQRYKCNHCHRSQQLCYSYQAYYVNTNHKIYKLVINSCGVSDMSRVLGISRNTISKRILELSQRISPPKLDETGQAYEVDELKVKCHQVENCWVTYGINKKIKQVVSFVIGGRSREYLGVVTETIMGWIETS
ncbi:IS1 family transposase [Seonamhaeicola maritimus]|uniref:IS1 family transposase n=1 Tax=Seonamhaeicola maritimus TaxID=2591822 RepID=A0A5C7GEV9_9FLAO|nr:IS1 family transposase [Seonamhaeicola maritimus]TXG35610.1 IS1 family transposase [Seonamhaeicola maritimus]